MDELAYVHYSPNLTRLVFATLLESSLKYLVGLLVSMVSVAPALAFSLPLPLPKPHPVPVPAPDLAVGAPAVLAVIAAYAIARLVVRHRATQKAIAS